MEATWVIKSKNLKKCLIVSDSKGALEKITNWKNAGKNDHITLSIRANLIYLYENDFSVRLVWIPSHTNIYGNEQADYLARNSSERSPIVRADVADFWPTFKRIVWERWKKRWIEKMGNRTFAQYVAPGSIGVKPWFLGVDLTRGNIVTINRLRTQHCCSPVHLHRIHIRERDLCSCGERGDITHIFFACKDNMENCSKLYNDLLKIKASGTFPLNIFDLLFSKNITVYRLLYNFLLASKIKL